MQLDISLSESQLAETQLSKAQKELKLEKSRREEADREHNRYYTVAKTLDLLKLVLTGTARIRKADYCFSCCVMEMLEIVNPELFDTAFFLNLLKLFFGL